MISNKLQLEANTDAIGDLQRRVTELEELNDSFKYQLRCELKSFLKSWANEEVGYIIVKRDRDQIVAQIKDNITQTILKDIK